MQFREKYHIRTSFLISFVSAVFLLVIISQPSSAGPFPGEGKVRHAAVLEKASRGEVQDLIVIFDQSAAVQRAASLRSFSGADHDTPDILREKSMIFRNKKHEALNELTSDDAEAIEDYDQLPVMFLKVKSQKGLERLAAQPVVVGIYENQKYTLLLNESLPLIDQPEVAVAGYTGNGTAVAVLDSGVDYTIASAFGTCTGNNTPGDCLSVPVAHAGCRIACVHDFAPNDGALDDDGHGTNVSGIVAGVAPDAFIINLDVFRPDWYAYTSDITSAINWVIKNKDTYNIVSMNMSFGGEGSKHPCSSDVFATPISNARVAGILSAIASGNESSPNKIVSPACVPAAVSVGAVYDGGPGTPANSADKVPSWSNSANFLTILAPGSVITAAGISVQGTSQATPHIAGSIAVLKSAFPAETTDETVFRMTSTGVPVLDTRNNIIKPRIDLVAATNRTMAAYTISGGVVSPIGFPVAGVTMILTGASVVTTVTDANGDYNFADIASGSYTITPSEGIITFTPAFREIIVKGSNISVKTIIANIHTIKGRVFTTSGKPVPGVTVTLGSDGSDIAMTDSDGRYVFSELGDGTYTITPEKDGYTFAPSSKTITINGADRTGKSFTAITYAINGYVRNASGNPLQGVTVQLTGEVTKTKITDTNGFYRFGNLPEGNYVVTPNKASKTFEPASRNVTISGNSVQLQKFSVSP